MGVYKVEGPFEVPFEVGAKGTKFISKPDDDFWEIAVGLNKQKGCYLFGIRAGRGIVPYYIGKATKSFRQEIFTAHKLQKYNHAMSDYSKGTPVMFFVVQQKGNWSAAEIGEIEKFLIPLAYLKNESLKNDQHIPQKKWSIHNVVGGENKGRISKSEKGLRNMLGISRKLR